MEELSLVFSWGGPIGVGVFLALLGVFIFLISKADEINKHTKAFAKEKGLKNKKKLVMRYPELVTVGIIEKDNQVLLIKRAEDVEEGGKWAMPGGTGAFKEKDISGPLDAVAREVKWDLGVKYTPEKLLGAYFRKDKPPKLSLVYIGKITGEISINEDSASDYKCYTDAELLKLDLAFDQNKMIRDYLSP